MSATEIFGIRAAVSGVACASKWRAKTESADNAIYCSASQNGPVRVAGNRDWHVGWKAYGSMPAKNPGVLFTFSGATKDGGGWKSESNGAIVEQVTIDWPVEGGKFVEHELSAAAASGALTANAAWAADSSIPNPVSAEGMGATFDGTAITNLAHMRLILLAKNGFIPADSSSNGRAVRTPGNIDALAIVRTNIPGFSSIPAADTFGELVLGSKTGVVPWTIRFMQFMGSTEVVEIETEDGRPKVVASDLHFAWTAYYNSETGSITGPSGTLWPSA